MQDLEDRLRAGLPPARARRIVEAQYSRAADRLADYERKIGRECPDQRRVLQSRLAAWLTVIAHHALTK